MEHYELLSSAVVSGIIPIKKYKSKETGFTVVLANVDGPLVNGYLTLATEAHDDDGLPHTLEHLVFMGSEEYPFKGMLDLFANRCLAQGTNAWTATDHTCYTMTTAGSEGFLNLLPIYLDHVLYPTLTNSAYVTEVHHVNGEGEDAGIVYCEMQARENSGYSRTFLEFLRSMYPGICGYKSETGGIMKNLRETCNHEKVCSYHAAFYRPENLCLVITGNVLPEDVFRAIRPFEEKIKAKGQLPPYNRPWMSQVPPLEKEVVEKHIIFATEDESAGMVLMGWRGPSILDHYLYTAFDMLFNYLTDTPIAPLQQDLVEIDEPFCGDVSFHLFEKSESSVLLHADNVPKEKLFDIKERVLSVLKNISSNNFDLDRMKTLLHRSILEQMNALEDTPHDTLASLSIVDFLYATNHNELQENVDKIKHLEKLQSENSSFWIGLLNQFVIGQKMIVIIGDPSDDFMKKSGEEEKNRVKNQAASLGVDGLKKKKEDLDTAIAENSVEPSKELVSSLKIPSTDSIKLHTITSHSNVSKNDENPDFKKFQLDGFPCEFHVYHVKSLFTQLYVVIDTASLSPELQMYLPLYSEVLLESPILKDGKVIPYEEVVKQLAADTLYTSTSIGVDGGRFYPGAFASILVIVFKVENEKYEKGVTWLKDILFNLQFSKDRLKLISNKMMSDVASQKRNGRRVAAVVLRDINYNKSSNFYASNMTRQHTFLTRLVENLDGNEEKVLSDMESLRTALLCSKNCRFYVASDLANLPEDAHNVWRNTMFQNMNVTSDRIEPVPRDGFYGTNATKAKIVGIGSVESAFLMQTCKSIDDYEHPDYPAMLVFIQYLCALEGPLWRQIRGCGLSYNYRISVSPNTGTINFILAKSTHVFNAYKKAQEIVDGFISGKTPFEHGQIEAAISGAVFQEIESVQTISDAISQNIISEYKRVPSTFQQVLLKNLSKVSVDDLKRVGSTYFTRLFDPAMTSVALCCHPTKVEEIVHSFASVGVNFETISTLEDEFSK